jgi:hypothetical protein
VEEDAATVIFPRPDQEILIARAAVTVADDAGRVKT